MTVVIPAVQLPTPYPAPSVEIGVEVEPVAVTTGVGVTDTLQFQVTNRGGIIFLRNEHATNPVTLTVVTSRDTFNRVSDHEVVLAAVSEYHLVHVKPAGFEKTAGSGLVEVTVPASADISVYLLSL